MPKQLQDASESKGSFYSYNHITFGQVLGWPISLRRFSQQLMADFTGALMHSAMQLSEENDLPYHFMHFFFHPELCLEFFALLFIAFESQCSVLQKT